MNRFRTKKKAKDDAPPPRPSLEAEPSSLSFKFRRGKKSHEEEQKKEIDLSNALPSTDDFRTSLIMTGLSARFSMLREQDDPNTKIGKASDDSVLFPAKRQSRLLDYGFGAGLADIAEVESVRGPPSFTRMGSSISDEASSSQVSSVLTRGKATEGNNLFGGRQKIYKIPASATAARNASGGMGGRALYEDDVAMSSFQRWRQQEKERLSLDGEASNPWSSPEPPQHQQQSTTEDRSGPRPESPVPLGYNRKRETSSTSSSVPSAARNSTAATSIASQPTGSIKDWQSQPTAPAPAPPSHTPSVVARTRRLYEQSLNQDLHDQQSSALSRIDTISRLRNLGSRTPDAPGVAASPSSNVSYGSFERPQGERRPILSKGSAPDLRSTSPLAPGSSIRPMDLGNKAPPPDPKSSSYAGSPPLSPPVSETGDHALLPIQPNDRGKATALGVFQKPVQPYDESKYAQRQLQLQQGRDTPTLGFRPESRTSLATDRSHSSSSAQPQLYDASAAPDRAAAAQPPSGPAPMTFLDDSDDDAEGADEPFAFTIPPGATGRPPDHDHPALRLLPEIPRSPPFAEDVAGHAATAAVKPELTLSSSDQPSPADSPTLGPAQLSAGLSGMVRQHLRSESNTSSIYDRPHVSATEAESQTRADAGTRDFLGDLGITSSNTWQESDWRISGELDGRDEGIGPFSPTRQDAPSEQPSEHWGSSTGGGGAAEDDFAHQLADAQRRVRERLTSYVESDRSRSVSPIGHSGLARESSTSLRSNGLSILKPKGSRGSIVDRQRDASHPKGLKTLGLGASATSTSPGPGRLEFDEKDRESFEGGAAGSRAASRAPNKAENDTDAADSDADAKIDEGLHPGLRAFRQARRELQKRKELGSLSRRQQGVPPRAGASPGQEGAPERQRGFSRERKPPVSLNSRHVPHEDQGSAGGSNSRSGSRAPSERDRSGSDLSVGPPPYARPPRPRNHPGPYDDHPEQPGLDTSARQLAARSPGLPGTDIRRSPIMPPQHGASSPHHFDRSPGATLQPGRFNASAGDAAPVSPLGGPLGLPSSPNMLKDTSGAGPEAGSRSPGYAPPLPPINPRRRGTRTGPGLSGGRGSEEPEDGAPSRATTEETRGALSASDDEDGRSGRGKMRKASFERAGLSARPNTVAYRQDKGHAPPYLGAGPLANRTAGASSHGGRATDEGVPGGMI